MKTDRQIWIEKALGWIFFVLVILLTCFVILYSSGCSTVTPAAVASHEASFDGSEQNSGIITTTPAGYVVTAHFIDRYAALIRTYGRDFKPPLVKDAGVTPLSDPAQFQIDREHMVKFSEMNAWLRAGLHPVNP